MIYLHFCLEILVVYKNSLIKMLRLISEFLTSQTGQQIAIQLQLEYTYCPVSQEVKSQPDNELRSVNITSEIIFLKNYTQNVVEKLVPDSFIKITIEHISGSK